MGLTAGVILLAAAIGVPLGQSIGYSDFAESGFGGGNGHQGVTFSVDTTIDFSNNGTPGWNPTLTYAYQYVTNGLDALCDRSRVFSFGWTEIGNKNWAGSPFPLVASDGTKYDYFTWPSPAAGWTMRSWWQIDDQFSGGQCDYGGGVGVYRTSPTSGNVQEIIPSP